MPAEQAIECHRVGQRVTLAVAHNHLAALKPEEAFDVAMRLQVQHLGIEGFYRGERAWTHQRGPPTLAQPRVSFPWQTAWSELQLWNINIARTPSDQG